MRSAAFGLLDGIARIRKLRKHRGGRRAESFDDLVSDGDKARDAKEWNSAISSYRAAWETKPEAVHIAVQLGHALKEAGRYAEAEECYKSFLARNSEDADIHLQMGHLFLLQNRDGEARRWYAEAGARAQVGSSIAEDAQRGLEACARASSATLRNHALALTDRGRFEQASRFYWTSLRKRGTKI